MMTLGTKTTFFSYKYLSEVNMKFSALVIFCVEINFKQTGSISQIYLLHFEHCIIYKKWINSGTNFYKKLFKMVWPLQSLQNSFKTLKITRKKRKMIYTNNLRFKRMSCKGSVLQRNCLAE